MSCIKQNHLINEQLNIEQPIVYFEVHCLNGWDCFKEKKAIHCQSMEAMDANMFVLTNIATDVSKHDCLLVQRCRAGW